MEDVDKVYNELERIHGILSVGAIGMTFVTFVGAVGIMGLTVSLGRIDGTLEKLVQQQISNSVKPHTETFGAERQERKYVEVMVEGKPVKAYFEFDGNLAQDYFNNQK